MSLNEFTQQEIINDVLKHRIEQDANHPWFDTNFADQFCVLAEEVGEVACEQNELKQGNINQEIFRKRVREELIQVAAVAIRMIEELA